MYEYKLAGENEDEAMDQLSRNLHTLIHDERLEQSMSPYRVTFGVLGGFVFGVLGTILLRNAN